MIKISILLAEDHPIARRGVKSILESSGIVNSIVEAVNGKEAVALYQKYRSDIVLMDFSMPELNGYEASKLILKKDKAARIIAFTQYDELPIVLNFLKIGAKGFLTKTAVEKEIPDAIRTVMTGNYYYHT